LSQNAKRGDSADVTAALSPLQKLTRRVNKYFSVAENKAIRALKFINKKSS
jgi:hypothetical protein